MANKVLNTTSRVAVTSRSFSRHFDLRQELLASYAQVTFNESGQVLAGNDLVEFLQGHDKAITALEKIDENLLAQLPQLKVISKYGVGLDTIDLEAMDRHGVQLGWKGGVNRRSVAEMVIAAAISLLHRTSESHAEVRAGQWRQLQGRQLTGKTVGIVGCGHIGKEVAILLSGFGCRILAHDIKNYAEFYIAKDIVPVSLEDLLSDADVVTIHLPLDISTRKMFSLERLKLMKKGACLINFARGGIVDESGLKQLLKDGYLAGAALDVFNEEPPLDLELLNLPNLIATGHIGGSTGEAVLAMGRAAIIGLDSAKPARNYTEIF
ncbi:D-3-phosphoglycerate dehydrogenase [Raphidiopsis brookii D9]|nr:D-3-phosphoglycerate dehydrogenase [Raphidiopsis brookii D9]